MSSSLVVPQLVFSLRARYVPPPQSSGGMSTGEAEKARIGAEAYRLVTARDKKYTNFIEFNSYKLIYRRYASLFFTIAMDIADSELSYLEMVHLFVELLDSFFSNVCELDIVFNFSKVYIASWMNSCWRGKWKNPASEKFSTESNFWKRWNKNNRSFSKHYFTSSLINGRNFSNT